MGWNSCWILWSNSNQKEYNLVLIDKYSRFPLCETIFSTAAEPVIKRLEVLFSIFGIPNEVESDNGAPFNCGKFKEFEIYLGFKSRLFTPLWALANGLMESFMKNWTKVIQTAIIDKVSLNQDLLSFFEIIVWRHIQQQV